MYGGRNPILASTVTDGVCSATVSSVTFGNLGDVAGSGVAGLEAPLRMRTSGSPDSPEGRGLILENIDGFANPAVFRKSPHLLNLSRTGPFGFSGDVPDLQTFATRAVRQHLPRTLTRTETGSNPDFRLPTTAELAAMEAFMLAQEFPTGSDPDKFNLDLFAVILSQQRGREAFFGTAAKCSQCHGGTVLAATTVSIQGKAIGINAAFNTGVVNQSINAPLGDNLPCEPSVVAVGACGSREFSVPQLFNVKHLGPFFHDGSAATVQQAVEFYTSTAFNNSPSGVAIDGIAISASVIADITAFLEGLVANTAPTITVIGNQTTAEDTPTTATAFTVGDGQSTAADLTVTGSSSNLALVPNANITFGGSGASRTVTVAPAGNQSGTATITATVTDVGLSTNTTFQVTVTPVNDAPTIAAISDQTTDEDTATGALAFTVGDAESAAGSLTLSGSSSNTMLVPNASITFGGGGANRTVTVTPALNQFGTATITVAVNDGTLSTSTTFQLTVNGVNDAPTITAIGDQTTHEDSATGAIAHTVGDVETEAASLTLSGSSSNTMLVPSASIAFGGGGANRTVTVTPALNQSGTATITVTVSDGTNPTSTSFQVTVNAVDDAPTIAVIANQATKRSIATGAIPFTVGDAETAAASLTLAGTSSNTTLVPNGNIALGGSGASWSVTVTPAAGQGGTATITLTVNDGGLSTSTSFQLTVTEFTDDPPVTGTTSIKVVQITELRTRIDAVRIARGLTGFSWTDPALTAGSTVIRAQHILDLRAALEQAYVAAGRIHPPTPTRCWERARA